MLDWMPPQVSSFGADIDSIIHLIDRLAWAWFFILHLLGLYMLVAFRRREGRKAQYLTGENRRQLAWILVPTFVILCLDLWIDHKAAPVWAAVKEETPPHDVEVRITGKQFNWEIQYAGPDAKLDTKDDYKTENVLNVPVDKVVLVQLGSKDVLHSFFLPNMRLKQDAVPGRTIPVWFKATQAGKYEIACAELCGFGHTTMKGRLNIHSPAEWQEWSNKRWPSAAPAAGVQGGTY